MKRTAKQVAAALSRLGVPIRFCPEPDKRSFLPGAWIDRGELCVCPWAAHPGDVLHEAGHLAVVPSRFRSVITPGPIDSEGSPLITTVMEWMLTEEAFDLLKGDPDHPLRRALVQMGECEAICWAYAAAVEIEFPTRDAFVYSYPNVPMEQQPSQGDGEEVWSCLQMHSHLGIHGLQFAGMCDARAYPKMIRWMQE